MKQFLYNPKNPKKSFDVYIDKNPKDTISIKYSTVDDVKNTIKKLERLYKSGKYSHKRIWQVGMIMKVRLEAMYKHKNKYKKAKNIYSRYKLADKYFKFLSKRTKTDKSDRKKISFKIYMSKTKRVLRNTNNKTCKSRKMTNCCPHMMPVNGKYMATTKKHNLKYKGKTYVIKTCCPACAMSMKTMAKNHPSKFAKTYISRTEKNALVLKNRHTGKVVQRAPLKRRKTNKKSRTKRSSRKKRRNTRRGGIGPGFKSVNPFNPNYGDHNANDYKLPVTPQNCQMCRNSGWPTGCPPKSKC